MQIVTGYTGAAHVTSNAAQGFNQGVFGNGNYVLNVGQKFAATMTNATTVSLEDGEGVMQGVHFRIEPGMTETVTITSGTAGYKRIDLICARYTKNQSTGVEDVSLVVVEGTPSSSTPTAPTYNEGDILAGDSPVDFPIWAVSLDGLTPTVSEPTANPHVSGLVDLIYPVGSIYMSVNSANPSLLFGGVWEAWGAGKVPVGVNSSDTDFNTVEKTGGEKKHTLTVAELASHTHSVWPIEANRGHMSVYFAQNAWNAPGGTSNGFIMSSGSDDPQSSATGSGTAHNNLQPYITCYMWKRTA